MLGVAWGVGARGKRIGAVTRDGGHCAQSVAAFEALCARSAAAGACAGGERPASGAARGMAGARAERGRRAERGWRCFLWIRWPRWWAAVALALATRRV